MSPLAKYKRDQIEEDLVILGLTNPVYTNGFRTIWSLGPHDERSTKAILYSLPEHCIGNIRRQVDNAFKAVAASRHNAK
jgi:hypothetical protein